MLVDALEVIAAEIHSSHAWTAAELEQLGLIPDLPRSFLLGDGDKPAHSRRFLVRARRPNPSGQALLAIAACGLPITGFYARLWGPYVQPGAPAATASRCLEALTNLLADTPATHMLTVLDKNDARSRDQFEELGYTKMTDVLHLVRAQSNHDTVAPANADILARPRVELSAVDAASFERFLALLQATYQQSDDCPTLAEQVSLDDVKSRWRRTPAASRAAGWHIASIVQDGAPIDVGCLVLDLTAQSDHAELVYMGLVEEQRGKGLGAELLWHAQRMMRRSGRNKTIVSVDANNERALACYLSQGFVCYAESSVVVRPLDQ